jgi:hypothetical protein
MSLVRTLESEGIREDSYRVDEVDAVLGEVRFPLRLVPLEHVTGLYGISVGLVNAPNLEGSASAASTSSDRRLVATPGLIATTT